MKKVRLFLLFELANLHGILAYKVDFFVSFFAGMLYQTMGFLFLNVLFTNISSIAGWNIHELAILYGYIFWAEGILTLLFQGTHSLFDHVRVGHFDQYMIRPLSIPFQIYTRELNLAGIGTAIAGLAIIISSCVELNIKWVIWKIVILIISLCLSACIRINMNFSASLLEMILESASGIRGAIEKIQDLGKYPLEIYPRTFRILLITIIPYAAISYIPTTVLLGKNSIMFILLLPLCTLLSIVIRKILFYKAMQFYEGSGN